jgi:hypothetical protein
MKTAPTNKKIREIISLVKEGKLIPRPEFQRRLVWTKADKDHFIDSILRGYPFPEIYLADGSVNLETGDGTQILVDGLQRVSIMIQYFEGSEELRLTSVPSYKSLGETEKKNYLLYDVAVRDLGSVSKEEILEVFKRINATKYSLLDIEVSNAVYSGALKQAADKLSFNEFFGKHNIFNATDIKRMGDLRYTLTIIITIIIGYFNRDDEFGPMLERFNDEFPTRDEIEKRLNLTFEFIEECGFDDKSRVWKKADLFTLIIEVDRALNKNYIKLQPSTVLKSLNAFFDSIAEDSIKSDDIRSIYYKAALQASNDKANRVRRGAIISRLLTGQDTKGIQAEIQQLNLDI